MALNYVWILFFAIGLVIALVKLIVFQDYEIFKKLVEGIFDASKSSVMDIGLPLTGVMVFFMGLMNIGEKAGAINFLARLLNPFMKRLFPEVPDKHPAMGQMVMNFSANMLGLDNAATPFGLKAMESLQTLNPVKDTASNAQIMFLVLHTSGLTLIPLSIIAYRAGGGSTNPTSVFVPLMIATTIATIASIVITGIYQRLRFDRVLIIWLGGIITTILLFAWFIHGLPSQKNIPEPTLFTKETFSNVLGNFILFVIISAFIIGGFLKKVNVFEAFIDGAKQGWDVIIKIIPYLVGMLVAIRVFRDSGALDWIINGITWCFVNMGLTADFVPALPVAIMRPFSGGGARGLMLDVFKTHGADSFVGQLASTFQGSADTTFYIIALYFGSVGIKRVRYAIWAGIFADIIGVIAAICIAYIFFA
ncbi:nucleoside recognition domain-containing protein [Sediminibacterium ginsengisoli]|uniref:Spore maturation protein SpmA n=1 Tax=Sediminibacterium ginsengisoli TaxID=413434 RepID=A0A1T4R9I0_9BACT|nr:spore maturation protein [Sediminibacterium ginsengisoli]SKA12589.1 Spore maturation protein SpmA [Sediminibacterium ginsengisoli]